MGHIGKTHFLFLTFHFVQFCWTESSAPRVLGGRYAELGEAPYIVLLTDITAHQKCDGVIIHENWVITARHCLRAKIAVAVAGFIDVRKMKGAQVRMIVATFRSLMGDMALLKLDAPFNFDGPFVAKIDLPKPDYKPSGFLEIFGWGNSGYKKRETKLKVRIYCVLKVL
jgi:Trypsin